MANHHVLSDPAFNCVVKNNTAFIIWRVEVYFLKTYGLGIEMYE